MSIPVPVGLVIIAAPVTLTFPPPFALRNPMPLFPETASVPNERVPEELFCSEIPSVPPEQLVLPKLTFAVEAVIEMHCVVLPARVVPPVTVSEPPIDSSEIPCAALEVVLMFVKVAASVPLSRFKACPVPLKPTSLIVRVPNAELGGAGDVIIFAPVVLPMFNPRIVALAAFAIVIALVAATVVPSVGALPVAGS